MNQVCLVNKYYAPIDLHPQMLFLIDRGHDQMSGWGGGVITGFSVLVAGRIWCCRPTVGGS